MQKSWLNWARNRSWVQGVTTLLTNSYLTQSVTKSIPCPSLNCYACPAAVFACPIGSIQNFAGRHKFPFYVVGMLSVVGIVIGRASCGWFCPFGWFQDLMHKIPVPKLRLPNRYNWTRYVFLIGLVGIIPFLTHEPWFSKLCPTGTLEAALPVMFLYPDLRSQIGGLFWIKIALLVFFLVWMTVTLRPFCRWVCPLGAIWSPFNPISLFRLEVAHDQCGQCNRCQAVCPVDIRVYESPNSDACIRCLACMRACPHNCISVTTLAAGRAPLAARQPSK
jgi:ferredoxin-type protein NapH